MKKRTRLFNFLIDSTIYFILVILFSMIFRDHIEREVLKYYMILLYYLYYFIFEMTTGKTIGKLITKTTVVDIKSGNTPNFFRILIRTLSRLIPIDFLSYLFLSNGIHDILSRTELKREQQ